MPKLTKDEFKAGLLDNIDDLYLAYVKTEAAEQDPLDSIIDLAGSAADNLPEFKASDPVLTEEQITEKIDGLAKAIKAEKIVLNLGVTAIKLYLKSTGLPL